MLKIQPKTFIVGKKLIYLPTCHSTNVYAAEIIQSKDFVNGTVIVAGHQTQGKGQRGNQWESLPNQNLLMSLIIVPDFLSIQHQFFLSMAVAVSVKETLDHFNIKHVTIKWPNDIYIGEKKIGGILIESSLSGAKISSSIIGLGLNVFQEKFENGRASSLLKENNHLKISISELVERFCECFETQFNALKKSNFVAIKRLYMSDLLWINESKLFRDKTGIFVGKIIDIEENGKLTVESENSTINTYDIKEIEYLF